MAKTNPESQQQGDKAIIDHLAEKVFTPRPAEKHEPKVQSPTTSSGEVVEEQIHKEWDPKKNGGLPVFARRRSSS